MLAGAGSASARAKTDRFMKASLIIAAALLAWGTLDGQAPFSRRYDFGFPSAILTSILPGDSCYYATGVITDSIFPYRAGNIFVKFSLEGEVLSASTLRHAAKTYETWYGNLSFNQDGNLAVAGFSVEPGGRKSMLIVYGLDGDTLFTGQHFHPNYPEVNGVLTRDFKEVEDGYLLLSQVREPGGAPTQAIEVLKLDRQGAFQWSRTYGSPTQRESPYSIIPAEGGYIVSSIRSNNATINRVARNHIFKVGADGELLWTYLSPAGQLRPGSCWAIPTSDGGLLVSTGQGIEIYVNPHYTDIRWHNYVVKLNSARQQEWGVLVRDSLPAWGGVNSLAGAIELENGEGYVVAGNLAEFHPERSWHVGVMAKIGTSGSLLWQRHYQHLEGAWFLHELYDIAQSPDGGFIMVGRVRDTIDAPRQQGWLLKVDEHGCLVPGCQLVSTREAGAPPAPALHLYPNPAAEALYVLLKDERIAQRQEAQLRLLDMQGRPLRTWPAGPFDEATSVLPLKGLPAGVYVLQYVADGQVLGAERVVVR
jgi:hypothetical protein